MLLKNLFLGAIDAKNELITSSEEELDRFIFNFLIPPTVQIEELFRGEKYFVTGMKGIGKTSLLRFLDINMRRDSAALTNFFLFKSHFTEDERNTFSKAAKETQLVDSDVVKLDGLSFESLWKWFIYKSLVALIESNRENSPFALDNNWELFKACVLAPQRDDERSGIRRLLPRLSSGKVTVSATPAIEIDFEWDDKEKKTVQFSRLTRQAGELFDRLVPNSGKIMFFFDELELNTTNPDRKRRDAELIRDLVIAVEHFNGSCRAKGFRVGIVAAIRSEVLLSIDSVGKEINKSISDFGVPVIWSRGGITDLEHPLLNIIIRRLEYSERISNAHAQVDAKSLWGCYFPKAILGKQAPHYLLEMTWHRPRDLIRLLNIARTQFPTSSKFDENSLTASKKEYSYQSWIEISEELAARYDKTEIDAIRVILSGFSRYFNLVTFYDRLERMSAQHAGVRNFSEKYGAQQILHDIYSVGIIGNKTDVFQKNKPAYKYRYYFRGDFLPILDNDFVVHTALCPFFGII